MPEPIATWNSARGAWETAELSMLCGHSVLFSETFPTSGTWDATGLYPLPTRGHRTVASGFSSLHGLLPTPMTVNRDVLLPTPSAGNFNDGESLESWEARRQANLAKGINGNGQGTPLAVAAQQLLKTPTAQLGVNGGSQHPDKRRQGGHGPTLADQVEHLLPTPNATDGKGGNVPLGRDRGGRPRTIADADLPAAVALLPTPASADGNGNGVSAAGREGSPSLAGMLLPTPTVADSRGTRNATAKRNDPKPTTSTDGWTLSDVFWTGDNTPGPSNDGNVS